MSESSITKILSELESLEGDGLDAVSLVDVTAVLAAAIRVATAKAEQEDVEIPFSDRDVSATQAVSVASALLHAQHLNAFDLELWSAGRYASH